MIEKMETNNKLKRNPVVVVMGHIDHGKSTLLDYIRKTNTTDKEVGGITQHLSAYEVEMNVGNETKKITFLDTPGHEAFCSIRERGAQVADIAVLVVSAEDGVKPQTIEALNCIKTNEMPFIVALNKIDKANANIDKIKQNLAENNIFVEGWGGTIPFVPISAKTGQGIPELLEIISLQSEIEDLKGNLNIKAEGFVVESNLNPKKGISATLIIKDGSIKIGDFVATTGAYAPVRSIENFRGEAIKDASFSSPIRIVGWNSQPYVGSEFKTFNKKDEAIEYSSQKNEHKNSGIEEIGNFATLDVVVKADTFGSLDAVEHELQKIGNEKIKIKIISKGIGTISEKDVKTAMIKNSLIIGFNVSTDKIAEMLALRENIKIKNYNIIYELIDFVKEKLRESTPIEKVEVVSGIVKIIKTFSKNKDKQVVGGRVEEGEIKLGENAKIWRREALIGEGKIKELQSQKIKTNEVKQGEEFGMMIESKIEVAPGDILKIVSFSK